MATWYTMAKQQQQELCVSRLSIRDFYEMVKVPIQKCFGYILQVH